MISTAFAATAQVVEEAAEHAVDQGPFYATAEFWVAVAFVIVVGFAARPLFRAIAAALDMRRDKIKARLDEAHRLREDAQEMLVTYQRKQRDAMREAEEIVAHAKAEAERVTEQSIRDLEASLKRREAQAIDRITQAEAQAVAEVRNLAVDIAIAATRKIIAENLTAKQANALVDQSIKELSGKLH